MRLHQHFYLTIFKIHGVNFDIRVQTPGKFASAQPIPQLIIPAWTFIKQRERAKILSAQVVGFFQEKKKDEKI